MFVLNSKKRTKKKTDKTRSSERNKIKGYRNRERARAKNVKVAQTRRW